MSVLITFVAINYEEMLKKDFASKYFLEVNVVVIRTNFPSEEILKKDFASKYFVEVKVVVIRTNLPSVINHMLLSLFLELVISYP